MRFGLGRFNTEEEIDYAAGRIVESVRKLRALSTQKCYNLSSFLFEKIQGTSMPKLKTHKGASKRFKKTGTGKVVRNHAFGRHILTSKPHKRKKKAASERGGRQGRPARF